MGIKKWKRENYSRLMRHLWQGSDWLLQYGLRVATTLGEKHEKSWNGLKSVITFFLLFILIFFILFCFYSLC